MREPSQRRLQNALYPNGNPVIVPKNLPGADGIVAANTLFANSDRLGLTIGALANTSGLDPLLGTPGARFDAQKFDWLGSIGKVSNVCATWFTSPIKTFADVKEHETVVAGAGASTNSVIVPRMLNLLLGTKFKVVVGYESSAQEIAVENGEVAGICGLSWSTCRKAIRPDWIVNKRLNVILQMAMTPLARTARRSERARSGRRRSDNRKVLEFLLIRQEMGRPFATPPDVPAGPRRGAAQSLRRRYYFRSGFPERRQTQSLAQEIDPLSGTEIDQLLAKAYSEPSDIVSKAKNIIDQATNGK